MLALGRIGECWPQLDVIKVEGCDVPKARVGVFVARPVGLSLVSKKNAPHCSVSPPRDLSI